jgi:hypothetical protein
VDHFVALLPVSSTTDPESARVAPAALERESAGGSAKDLARRVTPLARVVAHLLPPAVS